MTLDEFAELCRQHVSKTAFELTNLAAREGISEIDMVSARIAHLIELAAMLAVAQKVGKETFRKICDTAYDDACG